MQSNLNEETVEYVDSSEIDIDVGPDSVSELDRRKKAYAAWLEKPEQRDRLIKRAQNNQVGANDKAAQVLLYNLCKRPDNAAEGCIFFIENFCWTFDPRSENKYLPVVLFDYQKDAVKYIIEHIDHGKNFLIEKSRDMGVSWLITYVFIWYWLFRDGVNLLVGSYKEKYVDDGSNHDAIFGKIELTLRALPKWILPSRFKVGKHRQNLKLINPENNNIISGDTMNPQFGRGARKTAIFYDELGFWKDAKDAWEAGADATFCQIANSTPHGKNYYYSLRTSGMDVLTLPWRLHPLKDDAWYQYEKSRRTEESIAQEIDLNYEKSLSGKVYPEWQPMEGFYPYNDNAPLYVGCDWGKSDGTALIWAQLVDGKLRIVDAFYKTGETIDFFVPFLTGIVPSDDFRYSRKELEKIEKHRRWKRGTVFGDPAGRFTSAVTNQSVFSILRDSGIYVNYEERWKEFQTRRTAVKMRIRNGVEIDKNPDTDYLSLCIQEAAYPSVRRNGEDEVKAVKPNHDWTSHHRSALEYLCLGLENARTSRVKVIDKFVKNGRTFNPYVRRRR
jgi:hypothetical protein